MLRALDCLTSKQYRRTSHTILTETCNETEDAENLLRFFSTSGNSVSFQKHDQNHAAVYARQAFKSLHIVQRHSICLMQQKAHSICLMQQGAGIVCHTVALLLEECSGHAESLRTHRGVIDRAPHKGKNKKSCCFWTVCLSQFCRN